MAGAAPADLPIYNLMEGADPAPHKKLGDVMGVQGTKRREIRLSNLSRNILESGSVPSNTT